MPTELWPSFDVTPAKLSPKTIIEQAGAGLEEKTKGLVVFRLSNKSIVGETLSLTCSLYSRALAYNYPFLKVRFPLVEGYPVELVADKLPGTLLAKDEAELLDMLGTIFQAPSTVDTIQKLIGLSV